MPCQVRVLTDMFASMLMNAYVLRRSKLKLPKSYSSFDFLANLLNQLSPEPTPLHDEETPVQEHPAGLDKDGNDRKVEAKFWGTPAATAWRLDNKDHWCQDANKTFHKVSNRVGKKGFIRNELRRKCRWCNERTVFYCTKCAAPLCIVECFKLFHTKSKMP